MTRANDHDEDEEESYEDWSDDDDNDDADDPDAPDPDEWVTIPCPYCRSEISEDCVRCPRCGEYTSREDAPPAPKTHFWAVMVALALFGMLYWLLLL